MQDYHNLMDFLLFLSMGGFGIGSIIGMFLSLRSGHISLQWLLAFAKNIGFGATFVSSGAVFFLGLSTILFEQQISFQLIQTPLRGELSFHIDYISAFFLLVITLFVFGVFSILYLKEELKSNDLVSFILILGAVYFAFKEWTQSPC